MAFQTTRRVEFRHTDAAGIAHFSDLLGYMEEAEHEFLRFVGLRVLMHDEIGPISWPRVSMKVDFHGAVRFEDEVRITVEVARLGRKSVTYRFTLSHGDRRVAAAEVTAVCCRLSDSALPHSIAIPAWVADKLRPHVAPTSE